jgi:hypothetical protein
VLILLAKTETNSDRLLQDETVRYIHFSAVSRTSDSTLFFCHGEISFVGCVDRDDYFLKQRLRVLILLAELIRNNRLIQLWL